MRKHKKIILSLLITIFIILNFTFVDRVLSATDKTTTPEGNTEITTVNPLGESSSTELPPADGPAISAEEAEQLNQNATWTMIQDPSAQPNKDFPDSPEVHNSGHTKAVGDDFSWLDLKLHGDMLCNDRGVTLMGVDSSDYDYHKMEEDAKQHYDPVYGYYSDGKPTGDRPISRSIIESISGGHKADPRQAYILAYATDPTATEFSPAQLAWWGGSGGGLGEAAQEFADYVDEANKKAKEAGIDKERTEDDFGKKIPDKYFKVKYWPQWYFGENNSDESLLYPTVKIDETEDDIIVGYYAIDYVYSKNFAYITNIEIETNSTERKNLKLHEDFEILVESEEDVTENGFPTPQSKFQFLIKNRHGATKITSINVVFHFTDGYGEFAVANTKAWEVTGVDEVKVPDTQWVDDGNGEGHYEPYQKLIGYHWTLTEKKTQPGVMDIEAEIQTFHAVLCRDSIRESQIEIMKNVIDSTDGKGLDVDKFYEFRVTVNGAQETEPEIIKVKADSKAVSRVYTWGNENPTKEYTCPKPYCEKKHTHQGEEDAIPTFRVEEHMPDGSWVEVGSGSLEDNKTVKVTVNNQIEPKKGSLKIEKKIVNQEGNSENAPVNAVFKFNVTITGKFRYNGGDYKNQTVVIPVIINVAGGSSSSGKVDVITDSNNSITWYEDSPQYFIEEVEITQDDITKYGLDASGNINGIGVNNEKNKDNFNYSRVSITPSSGLLEDAKDLEIEAINSIGPKYGKVKIIKTLENSENISKEDLEKLVFEFKLTVDGHEPETIKLDKNSMKKTTVTRDGKEVDTYKWEEESDEYKWYGSAPNYTLEETYRSDDPEGKSLAAPVTGNLAAGELRDNIYVVENVITNRTTLKRGRLTINKIIDQKQIDALGDKTFNFIVKVTGQFTYIADEYPEGESPDDIAKFQTIQLIYNSQTNSNGYIVLNSEDEYNKEKFVEIPMNNKTQANWISGFFEWYGDEPKYTVEENLIDSDISCAINPGSGSLEDGKDIAVTAKNTIDDTDKVGYLHIIKTLTNSEKCSPEYIKSLIFKFKVEIDYEGEDRDEEDIITIEPELRDDIWVWEYKSDKYIWHEDEKAPHYRVTEIDIPIGIEFDEAETNNQHPDQGLSITSENLPMIEGELIENPVGVLEENDEEKTGVLFTDLYFINQFDGGKQHQGKLKLKKEITNNCLINQKASFKVTLSSSGTFDYSYKGDEAKSETDVKKGEITVTIPIKEETTESETIDISWYGDDAPSYIVEEVESPEAKVVSMKNEAGQIKEGEENVTTATFRNEPKKKSGYLEIVKQVLAGEYNISPDIVFYFDVTIGDKTQRIGLKAGEKYTSELIEWYACEDAPKYEVREVDVPEGYTPTEAVHTGSLEDNDTVTVIAENTAEMKHGKFKVTKEIVEEKFIVDLGGTYTFTFDISLTGTFIMNGDIHYASEPALVYTESITLAEGVFRDSYESPDIYWWEGEPPKVSVKEDETQLPMGWEQVGSPSNNNSELTADSEIEIIITNHLPIGTIVDLNISLGGKVWEDEKVASDGKHKVANGIMDTNSEGEVTERGVEGVEVYIYKSDGSLATIHGDNLDSTLEQPIITDANGNWQAPDVVLDQQNEKFNIEFVYDGQTYEPTTFLATEGNVEGSASEYKKAATGKTGRDKFFDRSMAKDTNRPEVDGRIQAIEGNTAINGNGETVGAVVGSNSETMINYKADVTNVEQNKKLKSELKTTGENGEVYDVFKAKATTAEGGLTYPFEEHLHLENYDITLTENGILESYTYTATEYYCLNINLGLVKRETADVEATKDLVSAKVIVDGQEQEYTFNKLQDVIKNNSTENFDDNYYERDLGYELGLYKTDYFYRSEMYKSNTDLYSALDSYYNSVLGNDENDLPRGVKDSELDVYLKYKLTLCNYSNDYKVKINEIADYYDSSFEGPINIDTTQELVDEKLKKVVDETNISTSESDKPNAYWQKQLSDNEEDPKNGEYTDISGDAMKTEWQTVEKNIKSSDGRMYNKMTLKTNNLELDRGERAEIYVVFKLRKDDIDGVRDSIMLGEKANIVEISSYSTIYREGKYADQNAGKIDLDSASDNVNIEDHNQLGWYEDDTDIAPALKLYLKDETREVNGIAWEDNKESETNANGNGVLDNDENVIGGLTTELVEKINIPTSEGKYDIYDFLWPTSESIGVFGGKTLEYLTGFASTIETSRELDETAGTYSFKGVPLGQHVVRFLYGNDKTKLEDQTKVNLEPARAINRNGNFASEEMYVSNYDGDKLGYTTVVYNGQDYKSTKSKVITELPTPEVTIESKNAEDSDASKGGIVTGETRESDAKDNEARRLEVIANSQTITNPNGTVLASANYKDELHTELYNQYDMFADTYQLVFKLDRDSENGAPIDKGNVTNNQDTNTSTEDTNQSNAQDDSEEETVVKYAFNNVDFGLIERPENNIVLDKQINEIILKTNDGKVVFDAIYDIAYKEDSLSDEIAKTKTIIEKLDDNRYLYADVTLNTEKSVGIDQLQAIDKNELKPTKLEPNSGTQNFRFINVDSEILQGTTLSINYLITALNIGEADYTGAELAGITEAKGNQKETKQEIRNLANIVKQMEVTARAETLGDGTKIIISELEKPTGEVERKYLGNFYDTGEKGEDKVVTTKVRQLVDYVDNDAVFNSTENEENDHIWRNTTITELSGSGIKENRILDQNVIPTLKKIDKHEVDYLVKQDVLDTSDPSSAKVTGKSVQRNSLILSVDDESAQSIAGETVEGASSTETVKSNAGFEKQLVPYDVVDSEDFEYTSSIILTISKTVAAQDDADNLSYDNISEIVKYENSVGRRDEAALVGNANPVIGEFKTSIQERDASATELITFTPPTGIETQEVMQTQFLIIVISSLVIVVIGIVIIKKKVLK